MNFYTQLNLINKKVDKIIKEVVIANKTPLNLNRFLLEITNEYPCNINQIQKRVNMWVGTHNALVIEDGFLKLNVEEE